MSSILNSIPNVLALIKAHQASPNRNEKLVLKTKLFKDTQEGSNSKLDMSAPMVPVATATATAAAVATVKPLVEVNPSTPMKVDVNSLVWAPLNPVKGKKQLFCARQIEGSELASARGIEFPIPDGHIAVEIFNLPKKHFWKYHTVEIGKVIPYYDSDGKSPSKRSRSTVDTASWNPSSALRDGMVCALRTKCKMNEVSFVVDEIYKTANEYLRYGMVWYIYIYI